MPMGERIREARRKKGLSQEEVARELGISRQAVTKWEGEQSAPSAGNLKKLAALLETTPGRLLNGDTGEKAAAAEYYALFREEEARRAAQRREQRKKNIRMPAPSQDALPFPRRIPFPLPKKGLFGTIKGNLEGEPHTGSYPRRRGQV